MEVDPELLAILVCPDCRAALRPLRDPGLHCVECGRVYPLRDGVPVLLVEEAADPGAERP